MLQCLALKSQSATSASQPNSPTTTTVDLHHLNGRSPPLSHGTSTDGTPVSSTQRSPNSNIRREYTFAVQSNSYSEMWSRIHVPDHDDGEEQQIINTDDENVYQWRLAQVLQPNRECVEEALRDATPNTLTRLVSNYFEHSENTTHSCLLLQKSVYLARALYDPLLKLLDILPLDPHLLTQSQCQFAYEIFLQFDNSDNPFPCPDSPNFQDIRRSFSLLREQLDRRLHKSRSRVRLVRRLSAASVLCIIGSVAAITIATVTITTHALAAIVTCPFCGTITNVPRNITRKERAHAKQLNAAARGTFVLNNDLGTIESLVGSLFAHVESDKHLIRLGLERDSDKQLISEMLKHLQKNVHSFIHQLKVVEEQICLCFNDVNKARSLLLQEIHLYQTSNS